MPRRYSQRTMCRLGATVVLRSACTPAAVTLRQKQPRRSSDLSAGRLLNVRTPTSVTFSHQLRSSDLSAGRLLNDRSASSDISLLKLRLSDVSAGMLLTALFELEQRAPPGDQALDASWGASSGTRGRGARAGASGAKTQHDSKIDRADMRPSTLTQRADASRLTPDDHHATPPHSLPDTTPRPIAPPSQPPFRHPTRCRLIRPSHTATFLRTPAHPGALPSPLLSSPRLLPCLVFNLSLN